MNTYPYVQLLSPLAITEISESTLSPLYQWGMADAELHVTHSTQGDQEQLVEWLAQNTQAITLIVPGEKVVTDRIVFNEKEKRHFMKMLPYELEDNIIENVDDLHFAVGLKHESQATVGYIDEEWFAGHLDFFEEKNIDVVRCIADFQLLRAVVDEISFWFSDGCVKVHSHYGLGLSTTDDLAPMMLQSFLSDIDKSTRLSIYTDPSFEQNDVDRIVNLFHTLAPEMESQFHRQLPDVSAFSPAIINFCCGSYGKKISSSQWIKELSWVAALAVVTLIVFLSVNSYEIYTLSGKNKLKRQEIEQVYRTVFPQGVMGDPVRNMTNKLSRMSTSSGESSQVVHLLSIVAPTIQTLNIDLSAVNYSNKERSMRLNVEADSFQVIEKLRVDLASKGLNAELLNSNAVDDRFQARLKVSSEG